MQDIVITKLFPYTNNPNIINKLKINAELLTYITTPKYADQINRIITKHFMNYSLDIGNIHITDGTACVGGNTIAFANYFKFVSSIELNKQTYDYLENNIRAYNISNINLYNDNCLNIIPTIIRQDCIFLDPPWGGADYKATDKMRIKIQDISLENICLNFFNKQIMKCCPKFIILKLPNNYDIYYMYIMLIKYKIYLYDLHKMIVLVIENNLL
jgi:16S rRNA G966 N2-methylase RsmD